MSNTPFVSIIMPTFNHGKYIKEAIDSVIAQTYKDWELIIVNNFSTDDTDELINTYSDPRIRKIDFSNNGIIAKSRNVGLKEATGTYIAFLDSDDIWIDNKLELQVNYLESKPKILLCCSLLRYIPKSNSYYSLHFFNRILSKRKVLRANVISNSSVLMRKVCLDYIGFLDESPQLRTIEDYDYWLRVLRYKDNSIVILNKSLLLYRISEQNESNIGRQFDPHALYEKFIRISQKDLSDKDMKRFLKFKKSQIVRQCIETKTDYMKSSFSGSDLLFSDRLRMVLRSIFNVI